MLKEIKKDLLSLQGKIFRTYDVEPFKKDSPTIQFINYLINQKIEVYPFGTCWNYENFIFDGSKYAILNCDKEDFLDLLDNFNLEIPCDGWQIEQKIIQEVGYIYAFCSENGEEFNGYYTEAPEEIKKAVEKYFF